MWFDQIPLNRLQKYLRMMPTNTERIFTWNKTKSKERCDPANVFVSRKMMSLFSQNQWGTIFSVCCWISPWFTSSASNQAIYNQKWVKWQMIRHVNVETNNLECKTKYKLFTRIYWHGYYLKPCKRHVYTYDRLWTVLNQNVLRITIRL